MIEHKTYRVSHLTALILGLFFYTSIGLLFVISDVTLRILVFLLLVYLVKFKKSHYLIIIISCIFGFLINFSPDWQAVISNMLSWGTLTGSIIGSILIYENIYTGGDFASISKFFKNKNKIAIHSYYVFKIIPMIIDLLDRLTKAFRVYGKRKYMGENKSNKINIFFDAIDSFYNELLTIMFSQERIMSRRENIAYTISQGKREINLKLLIIELLITFFVLATVLLHLFKIKLF